MNRPIRILGIDPGLRRTGWGVIACEGNRLLFVACGSVETHERAALAARDMDRVLDLLRGAPEL